MIPPIYIPSWLSYKIYNIGSETRVYCINELTRECFLFTDLTAEFFVQIVNFESNEKFNYFIKQNNLENEIDDFLNELLELGIISLSEDNNFSIPSSNLCTVEEEIENAQEYIIEMKKWFQENSVLGSLFLELTYSCNLNCIHCFNDKNSTNTYISFNEAKKIIDEAFDLGIYSVTISGGEATLANDFVKIIKYIKKRRLCLEVFTNGQLLYDNKKLFEELVNIFPHRISLSLYSMNPDEHDRITQIKGSHSKTLAVIEMLKEKNIPVEIKCFILKENFETYITVQEYAKKIGVSYSLDCNFFNNPNRRNEHVQLNYEQLVNIYNNETTPLKARKLVDISNSKHLDSHICAAGKDSLCIAPNLDVFVCPSLKKRLGNLKTISLKKLWLGNSITLKEIQNLKKYDLKECFKEEYCQYCTYCLGIAMMNNSYLKKYEQFCNHAKARMATIKNINVGQAMPDNKTKTT